MKWRFRLRAEALRRDKAAYAGDREKYERDIWESWESWESWENDRSVNREQADVVIPKVPKVPNRTTHGTRDPSSPYGLRRGKHTAIKPPAPFRALNLIP